MYSINPLQSSYIQLNFDILTIGILNTNWDVKMNWKSPLQLFFNMYLQKCTSKPLLLKSLDILKFFLVRSSLRWWNLIVYLYMVKLYQHKQTWKSWIFCFLFFFLHIIPRIICIDIFFQGQRWYVKGQGHSHHIC